jgi:hypothetical protein
VSLFIEVSSLKARGSYTSLVWLWRFSAVCAKLAAVRTPEQSLTSFSSPLALSRARESTRYFQTLQLLCITFFCCGLMNAQAITYYKSETYSDKQETDPLTGKPVPGMLRGSAVCTRTQIVCLDAECSVIDSANLCHMTTLQAWLDLSMTIMLLILMMIVTTVQNQISTQIDESIQTAQDYSVRRWKNADMV